MVGKIVAQMISCIIFVYMVVVGITFILHITITERVNDICYDVADTVGTEGVFSSEVYNYLRENLSRYGEYTVTVMLKDKGDTVTCYLYGEDEILDVPLEVGDRVIIAASSNDQSLFEKITGADSRISGVKIAVIG